MYQININQSRPAIIRQLLTNYEGKTNQIPAWFKKTASSFKKRYGFDLIGAPIIFKADGMIWKLSLIQSNYPAHLGGRKWEIADYKPIVNCGKYFDRLSIN